MNLGSENANNLISKNKDLQKIAARNIIERIDTDTFKKLVNKTDFLYDFIIEKINNNLLEAVNYENIENIISFTKVYSQEFEPFIIGALTKFSNANIHNKMSEILLNGTQEQQTYSVRYFTIMDNKEKMNLIKPLVKSDFQPLKSASINYLAQNNDKEEYNRSLEKIKTSKDEYEKAESCRFLIEYGDKDAFDVIYECLLTSPYQEILAQDILLLAPMSYIIKNKPQSTALKIYSLILKAMPEIAALDDVNNCLQDGMLDLLIENSGNYEVLLNFLLETKLYNMTKREEYKTELSKEEIETAVNLKNKLDEILDNYDLYEVLINALNSKNKDEILTALEVAASEEIDVSDEIKKLINETNDNDILLNAAIALKSLEMLDEYKETIISKTNNQELKAEITNL